MGERRCIKLCGDFGAAAFLSPPVGLIVGAASAGMAETMEAGLAPRHLAGRDCARCPPRRWRNYCADRTGGRGPPVRSAGDGSRGSSESGQRPRGS